MAFDKLEEEIPTISLYEVATGIKEITESFRNQDLKRGISGKQDLKNMTALYIAMRLVDHRGY